ncbi:D-alanyl-D-alanine carboxypeptidase family protein [Thermithiobacillus tepidarius DSM 3134]|uniref:M15 family metallopeptidase n=1 Tax=Thermithiobacillus tepidarius TaxID=929 RepID=UPI00041A1167|nr:M15 family metallopeptidase [Thermithiobacillus tepidarius]
MAKSFAEPVLPDLQEADYLVRIETALAALGTDAAAVWARRLPVCPEARVLTLVEVDAHGREHRLTPVAGAAWCRMRAAAAADGVSLAIQSGFRSFERQFEIIRSHVARGRTLAEVLAVYAPPGFSEHHTGRAVDVTTAGYRPSANSFDRTPAFAWLSANAQRYGFFLSYPENNPYGYGYEPWHWCCKPPLKSGHA